MKRYDPATWNISHLINDPKKRDFLINRTNNPLERFNKKLNDLGLTHPSVMQLLEALKKVSQDYVDDLFLARRQTHHRVIHKEATIHKIPNNYAGWKVPKK